MHAIACLFMALSLPVLGNRTAIAYLNTLSEDFESAPSSANSQLEPRDTKPKPTRQQLRVTIDKRTAEREAVRRGSLREMQNLHTATAVNAPVRGQRSLAIAMVKNAAPHYMKVYESPHSNLAPPG